MHEHDAAQGRSAPRPFTPRLVGGDQRPEQRAPIQQQRDAAPPQQGELHDPTVREIADSLADLFLGSDAVGDQDATPTRVREARPGACDVRVGRAPSAPCEDPSRPRASGQRLQARSSATNQAQRSNPLTVELLVLGHLPVLASVWVTQYAVQAARTLGKPVGLIRFDPDAVTIDLVGLKPGVTVARSETLGQALDAARSHVGAWILRVDELAEATVADAPGLDAITLLSGVSESSIVAAYRALKSIVQRAGARMASTVGEASAELRIALLGATSERAGEASQRIRKAAATFLGRPVGLVVCEQRIGPAGLATLYRGACDCTAIELLGLLAESATPVGAATVGVERPAREEAEVESRRAGTVPAPVSRGGETRQNSPAARRRAEDVASIADDADVDWLLEPTVAPAGGWAVEASARAGEAGNHPAPPGPGPKPVDGARGQVAEGEATAPVGASALAAMLGLVPVAFRCPEVPAVELAIDGGGGVHLICADEASAPEAGRVGVPALLAAEAWATSNADLIRRALSGSDLEQITLHLVTRVPASARALLGTRVKIHLLATATRAGDVCVGLN